MTVHLYKLVTGETVIALFENQQTVNEKTGEKIHMVKEPRVVDQNWELREWYPGYADTSVPIPVNAILLVAEGDSIEAGLDEHYLRITEVA